MPKAPPEFRPCPTCPVGEVYRLPVCARCWGAVPQEVKNALGRIRYGSPEYETALASVVHKLGTVER
jgi:hypothetical protein